jgi:hypothetical protein
VQDTFFDVLACFQQVATVNAGQQPARNRRRRPAVALLNENVGD